MEKETSHSKSANYQRFGAMLAISFVIMYAVMYLNVDSTDHIYLSLSRLYMTLLMISPMAIVMLLLMKMMYPDTKKNLIIYMTSIVVFIISLALLRTQTPVDDVQYMKAMIPHHSSAILTSKHADIKDPEVKELARQIIQSQEKEISQMKAALERLKK
jgi:hypothetical protein